MKILVLGGSGYIGSRLCAMLRDSDWADPVSASRRAGSGIAHAQLDTRDTAALTGTLRGFDALVNCVAGDAGSIAEGAKAIAQAAAAAGCARVVHLSSMSVYGALEGAALEESPGDSSVGWYGRAKREAEAHIAGFAHAGGTAVILRPGCVWGPGSQLWVGRVGRWLRAGRMGDLGAAGDGWSNLVHVDDVCRSIIAALRPAGPAGSTRTFNLAAPDSPRWNEYFVDLALAIGAIPVRRIWPLQLNIDAWLAGPALKVARSTLARMGRPVAGVPDHLSPGLIELWNRHLRLDSGAAERELQVQWTPYLSGLEESAAWYLQGEGHGG